MFGIKKFRHLLYLTNMELRKKSASNQSYIYDTFSSIRFIRSSKLESSFVNRFNGELQQLNKLNLKLAFISTSAQGIPQMIIIVSTICMIWFLGLQVLNHSMSLGAMLAFMAYQAGLYGTIQGLSQLYVRLQKGKVSIQRIKEFFHTERVKDGREALPSTFSCICFEKVSFAHDRNPPVIDQFNLAIYKGEKIGIVGENGVGKSTIANLLARMYEPTEGTITMDGKDIQTFKRENWYEKVCLVAHDDPILYGTVSEFLQLGNELVTKEQMIQVLNDVGLGELSKIHLHTSVGEKGVTLSSGQRQRLLLARALLKRPDLLILDEATCHIDKESEYGIFQYIQERFKKATVIVISHRQDNMAWVDRILHLSKYGGKLYESISRLHG